MMETVIVADSMLFNCCDSTECHAQSNVTVMRVDVCKPQCLLDHGIECLDCNIYEDMDFKCGRDRGQTRQPDSPPQTLLGSRSP